MRFTRGETFLRRVREVAFARSFFVVFLFLVGTVFRDCWLAESSWRAAQTPPLSSAITKSGTRHNFFTDAASLTRVIAAE